ncbi:hypothetical protein AAH994_15250 [Weeksellaceae bacterium A-14]
MGTKILTLFLMVSGTFAFSQTEIYFKYDEAGNQRYRGDKANSKQSSDNAANPIDNSTVQQSEEQKFWAEVGIYPVPVKDILTIQWTPVVDELIDTVSMYQYSVVSWNFQQKNMPNLNRQVQINMTGYYMGVYVLSFTLKDGRVYTKNILKE